MIDSQVFITEDVIQVVNDLVKQELTPDRIQFYNIYYELILSDLFKMVIYMTMTVMYPMLTGTLVLKYTVAECIIRSMSYYDNR